MFPQCPHCGLRPRYLVDGKWSTFDKISTQRVPVCNISVRPQHTRWCPSEDNRIRLFLRNTR